MFVGQNMIGCSIQAWADRLRSGILTGRSGSSSALLQNGSYCYVCTLATYVGLISVLNRGQNDATFCSTPECGQQICFCKISISPWLTEYHQMQLAWMVYTESLNTCLEAVHFTESSIFLLRTSCIEPKSGLLTLSKIRRHRQPCLLRGQREISSEVSAPSMEHRGGRHIHTDAHARMQVDFVFDGS